MRALLPPDRQDEAGWGDATEVVVYSLIPFVIVTGWWFARRSLQLLTTLAQTVERIDVERCASRSSARATAMKSIACRSVQHDGRETQPVVSADSRFHPDASHEPKTPLTVMRAELESALVQAGCPPRFRESLSACRRRSIGSRRSWTPTLAHSS